MESKVSILCLGFYILNYGLKGITKLQREKLKCKAMMKLCRQQDRLQRRHSYGSSTEEMEVKDGKIIRIRPLHYDAKHDPKELNPGKAWQIKGGKFCEPLMKTTGGLPFSIADKASASANKSNFCPGNRKHVRRLMRITGAHTRLMVTGHRLRYDPLSEPYW